MLPSRFLLLAMLGAFSIACRGDDRSAGAGRPGGGDSEDAAESDAAIKKAMADSASWPSYGRDYTNRRYSPLRQITPANADNPDTDRDAGAGRAVQSERGRIPADRRVRVGDQPDQGRAVARRARHTRPRGGAGGPTGETRLTRLTQ
jgi:hypothetical protein